MKPVRFLFITFSFIFFCLSAVAAAEDVPVNVWDKVYDSGKNDVPYAIAVDDSGYIYVAGLYYNGENSDFRTIKFDPDGEIVWNKTFGPASEDIAWAVAVSSAGSVYVAGESKDAYELVKYDSKGNELWNKSYESQYKYSDAAYGIALDEENGFCYLTGKVHNTATGNNDYRTIKCDTSGNKKWDNKYDSGADDCAYGVTVDKNGNIYVTGGTNSDTNMMTIKYGTSGNTIWKTPYSGGDKNSGRSITADNAGLVYVAGMSKNSEGGMDFCTVKYDSQGNQKWDKLHGSGSNEYACDAFLDKKGFLYETGPYYDGAYPHSQTIKYDLSGNIQWEMKYEQGTREESEGVAVDASGNVYIICKSYNDKDNDFRLLKYRQSSAIVEPRPEPQASVLEVTNGQSVITVSYSLQNSCSIELAVFDVKGSRVAILEQGSRDKGRHTVSWSPEANGVYFLRLRSGALTKTEKCVVIR